MQKINIYKDFEVKNIGKSSYVQAVIDRLELDSDNEIELNLTACGIDYFSTSKLIDTLLYHLAKLKNDKKLSILYDCDLPEEVIISWLLWGSTFFKFAEDKSLPPLAEIQKIINTRLKTEEIRLKISISDIDNSEIRFYKYGY